MSETALVQMLLLAALATQAPVDELLRAADAPRHRLEEGIVRIRATVEKPDSPATVSTLDVLVQGDERALCIFRDGPLLGRRILISGDKTWLIVPQTSRAIPITPGQRLLGGASIGDVASLRFARTYEARLRPGNENVAGTECSVLDLEAVSKKTSYRTGTLWIGAEDRLPKKAVFHLASGKPAKEVLFTRYDRREGQPILHTMRVRHLLPAERGTLTTLEYLDYEDRKLDPSIFEPSGARAVP